MSRSVQMPLVKGPIVPKVSVIIPTYNASMHIRHTLETVLHPTYRDFEVIVVDDGSTDDTVDILKTYGDCIRWAVQKHQGQAYAINRAIGMAKGEYLAYFDADDLMMPEKLEVQARYLDEHPEADLVYTSDTYLTPSMQRRLRRVSNPLDCFYLLQYCFILRIAVMHRRACLDKVGMFKEEITGADDWDMWIRMSEQCEMRYIDQILSTRRIHDANTSRTRVKPLHRIRRIRVIILQDACQRRGKPFWLRMMLVSAKLYNLIGKVPILGHCPPRFWGLMFRIQRFTEWLLLGWMATPPRPMKHVDFPAPSPMEHSRRKPCTETRCDEDRDIVNADDRSIRTREGVK